MDSSHDTSYPKPHLTRYAMYESIQKALPVPLQGKILGVTGIDFLRPMISSTADVMVVEYPEVDMHQLPFGAGTFDVVISDQVLEHLERPWQGVAESFRVLRPGGTAIHTSCFLQGIHGDWEGWGDYFRFTPAALKSMCPPGAEIVCCGGWGNRLANFLIGLSPNKVRYLKVPKRGPLHWLATRSEWRVPFSTWIVARKPGVG